MSGIINSGLGLLRSVAGKDTRIERTLRRGYWGAVHRVTRGRVGKEHLVFGARGRTRPRLGIYAFGSCDLPSVLACRPAIERAFGGTACIQRAGLVATARTDLVLQALDGVKPDAYRDVVARLRVPESMFQPVLFEPRIRIPTPRGEATFPKDVVILSIAADITRTLYRHRESGLLIDPGGGWLNQQMQFALEDRDAIAWAAKNFQAVGRLSAEQSMAQLRRVVQEVRRRTGGQVLVFNMLTVEPRSAVHNYQFLTRPLSIRVREFNVALADLAEETDLAVVDVDRVLKGGGVAGMADFAHDKRGLFPESHFQPLADEVMRVLHNLDVFGRATKRGPVG